MEIVFWISMGLIGYTYAGYPLLLLVMASLQQMRRGTKGLELAFQAGGFIFGATVMNDY